ncbi:CHASE3 domain sensor protein [Virgibacillus halotolerans]|nr:CHASE3 domain sensor protein [Virgibacillus halotolerans]
MWKAIRSNIGFSLLLLLFIVLTLLFFIGFIFSENSFSFKKETEQTVAGKYSEKDYISVRNIL